MVTITHPAQPASLAIVSSVSESSRFTASPNDERELLCRVAAQENQAFETLYHRAAPRVRGYITRCTCPPDLIDEVLQDVMLVLWQHAARVPPGVSLVAWLCGVARHKARKAFARADTTVVLQPVPEDIDDDEPEAALLRQEQRHTLARVLATLPLCEQTALELLVYKGCSHQEIAALTNVPVSTVRTRVSRARQRLRLRVGTLEKSRGRDLATQRLVGAQSADVDVI